MISKIRLALQGVIPPRLHPYLVSSYDIVGDIAVIIIRDELRAYEEEIGQTIIDLTPHVQVVAKRAGHYSGEYRLLPLTVIAGERRTITEVKESGLRLRLDLETCYYSVRSGNERLRIASLVQRGEKIVVPFSGIGPYPIIIAKHSGAEKIVGIEKNSHAHKWAVGNQELNKKLHNIQFIESDFVDFAFSEARESWDRVIMPLPKGGYPFIESALHLTKSGGWMHFYDMRHKDSFEDGVEELKTAVESYGRRLLQAQVVTCGHCSPRTYRICIDAQVGS